MNAPTPSRLLKPIKPRKCANRSCRATFTPTRPLQAACRPSCAIALAEIKRKRERKEAQRVERAEIRARKEKVKRRADWVSETQAAVNAYVRLRDIKAGHGCIDCGKPFEPQKPGGSVDAGHYISRGAAPHLRFDAERNIFAQRKNCNRPGGATREAFRAGVIARIGLQAVEALEADQEPRKWSIAELKAIRDTYRAKLKELKSHE